jgi:hypothetical protein
VSERVSGRMKAEGGRMKGMLNSAFFILHPSAFILALTPARLPLAVL